MLSVKAREPRLAAVGIAQLVGGPALGGEPGFAAPKQVEGHMVDDWTDVYSLEPVLLAIMAGHQMLLDADALRTPLPQFAPDRVRDVLMQAMAPDPGKRLASVRSFLDALAWP